MKNEVDDKIDSMLNQLTNSDSEVISFVSDQNTNVDSVQFVIKAAGIEKTKIVETVNVTEEHLNFGQKLLRLFGLY
jgi:putative membrane protein